MSTAGTTAADVEVRSAQRQGLPAPPLLEVRDLHVSYRAGRKRRLHALRGVNLAVAAGEAVGVIGESGSGKSTLARAVLKLVRPDSGSIHLGGLDVTHLPERRFRPLRHRVQMVWQDPIGSLDPRMTLRRQLAEPLECLAVPRAEHPERIAQALRAVGLDADLVDRKPRQLSGGQAQRACIARAQLSEPDLVVFDEPTSALDVTIQAQVLQVVADLMHERSRGYLFVSHDLATLRGLCQRVIVFYLGVVVEEGDLDQVFRTPAHPYTRALLSSAPSLRGGTVTSPVVLRRSADIADEGTGCPLAARCPYVLARCWQEPQHLLPVGANGSHRAACWRVPELPQTRLVQLEALTIPEGPDAAKGGRL
jgi:peptide/nickel transport system ATP-binding protein